MCFFLLKHSSNEIVNSYSTFSSGYIQFQSSQIILAYPRKLMEARLRAFNLDRGSQSGPNLSVGGYLLMSRDISDGHS